MVRSLQIVISFIVQIQAWSEHPGVDQVIMILQESFNKQKLENFHLIADHWCHDCFGCYLHSDPGKPNQAKV